MKIIRIIVRIRDIFVSGLAFCIRKWTNEDNKTANVQTRTTLIIYTVGVMLLRCHKMITIVPINTAHQSMKSLMCLTIALKRSWFHEDDITLFLDESLGNITITYCCNFHVIINCTPLWSYDNICLVMGLQVTSRPMPQVTWWHPKVTLIVTSQLSL